MGGALFSLGLLVLGLLAGYGARSLHETVAVVASSPALLEACRQRGEAEKERREEAYFHALHVTLTGFAFRIPSSMPGGFDDLRRWYGNDWPVYGAAMTGVYRLQMVRHAVKDVLTRQVPGDFLEAGVWRGGTSLVARAALNFYGAPERKVYLCDSFEGLPTATTSADSNHWSKFSELRISQSVVADLFRRFRLENNVEYVRGFFQTSMPKLRDKVQRIAILRLDGDMFESTTDVLSCMYDRLEIGGYVIIDDGIIDEAMRAVKAFRERHNITEPAYKLPSDAVVWWIKAKQTKSDMAFYKTFNQKRKPAPPLKNAKNKPVPLKMGENFDPKSEKLKIIDWDTVK